MRVTATTFPLRSFLRGMYGHSPTRASALLALHRMAFRAEINFIPYVQSVTLIREDKTVPAVFISVDGGIVVGFNTDKDGDVRGVF